MYPRTVENSFGKPGFFSGVAHRYHAEGPVIPGNLQKSFQVLHALFLGIDPEPYRPEMQSLRLKKDVLGGGGTIQGPIAGKKLFLRVRKKSDSESAFKEHRTVGMKFGDPGNNLPIL
jgi:hypothetical protein